MLPLFDCLRCPAATHRQHFAMHRTDAAFLDTTNSTDCRLQKANTVLCSWFTSWLSIRGESRAADSDNDLTPHSLGSSSPFMSTSSSVFRPTSLFSTLLQFSSIFCRSTQCVGAAFAMATWLSVCLSRWCIVPRRLSRSSCNVYKIAAQPF